MRLNSYLLRQLTEAISAVSGRESPDVTVVELREGW